MIIVKIIKLMSYEKINQIRSVSLNIVFFAQFNPVFYIHTIDYQQLLRENLKLLSKFLIVTNLKYINY